MWAEASLTFDGPIIQPIHIVLEELNRLCTVTRAGFEQCTLVLLASRSGGASEKDRFALVTQHNYSTGAA